MRLADPALPERRRRQILDAARACFAARGLRQTTVEDVCAEIRISPGMLYRYFGSKTNIVAALVQEDHAEADAALESAVGPAALVAALAGARLEGDAALQAELWAEAAREPEVARHLTARAARTREWLAAKLGDGLKADLLLATVDGLAAACALDPAARPDAVRRFRELAEFVLTSGR